MFDRFDCAARRAILLAIREARRCQSDFLGTEHVLFGLLCDSSSAAPALLRTLGVGPERVLGHVEAQIAEDAPAAALDQFPLTPAARRAFDSARQEAQNHGHHLIGPEHLLLGLLHEPQSEAALLLARYDVALPQARHQLALLPAADFPNHGIVPPAPSRGGAKRDPEDSPDALGKLVVDPTMLPSTATQAIHVDSNQPRLAGVMAPHESNVESRLRTTQLALGSLLGFCLGYMGTGLAGGLLFALGGVAIAAMRNSMLGALAGLLVGLCAPPFTAEFPDRIISRVLVGITAAWFGSLLGYSTPQRPSYDDNPPFKEGDSD